MGRFSYSINKNHTKIKKINFENIDKNMMQYHYNVSYEKALAAIDSGLDELSRMAASASFSYIKYNLMKTMWENLLKEKKSLTQQAKNELGVTLCEVCTSILVEDSCDNCERVKATIYNNIKPQYDPRKPRDGHTPLALNSPTFQDKLLQHMKIRSYEIQRDGRTKSSRVRIPTRKTPQQNE